MNGFLFVTKSNKMKHYRGLLVILLLLILAEIVWSWRTDKKAYQVKDTFTNIAVFTGFQLSKFLFAGYRTIAFRT